MEPVGFVLAPASPPKKPLGLSGWIFSIRIFANGFVPFPARIAIMSVDSFSIPGEVATIGMSNRFKGRPS